MNEDRIAVRRDGHVAWMVFNRPDRLNAFLIETWVRMGDLLEELSADPQVRALVLAGEGKAFLAGHDVGEIREHSRDIAAGKITRDQLFEWQQCAQRTTTLIREAPFPVIAAAHGYTVGGGFEICVACDLVVAGEDAVFGCPEVNIGVTVTNGVTKLLPAKVGFNRALQIAYTGEFFDATEAYRIGFVNKLVPAGRHREEAETLARRIASRAPLSVRLHKQTFNRSAELPLDEVLKAESEAYLQASLSKDSIEGTNAWFDKREPKFEGR